jgi:hypothetical protein
VSLEVGLFAFVFEGKKSRWLKSATLDVDEIAEVLAAVAESKRRPKEVPLEWVAGYDMEDREPTNGDCYDPSEVRAALRWFVTELTSKESLPAAKEAFPLSNLGLRSYKAYVKQLVGDADEWIRFCDYASKKKALVVLAYVRLAPRADLGVRLDLGGDAVAVGDRPGHA